MCVPTLFNRAHFLQRSLFVDWSMNSKILKIGVIFLLMVMMISFFAFDLEEYATLDYLEQQQYILLEYYYQNVFRTLFIFGFAYVIVTAFSLPVATILTLLAGGLFGFAIGLTLVSFASSIGATSAFLMTRFLLKDFVQEKYSKQLNRINEEFKKEGAFYIFALRLVPAIPFFLVNILMSLLPIKARTFYWVSQLGMLPGTAIYVYAGTELGKINTLSDIASPSILFAFTLLGLFPIIAKKVLNFIRSKKHA